MLSVNARHPSPCHLRRLRRRSRYHPPPPRTNTSIRHRLCPSVRVHRHTHSTRSASQHPTAATSRASGLRHKVVRGLRSTHYPDQAHPREVVPLLWVSPRTSRRPRKGNLCSGFLPQQQRPFFVCMFMISSFFFYLASCIAEVGLAQCLMDNFSRWIRLSGYALVRTKHDSCSLAQNGSDAPPHACVTTQKIKKWAPSANSGLLRAVV